MSSRYQAGLVSRGADVPSYPTKAAALKAAKEEARAHPGKLVSFYGEAWPRGASSSRIEQRFFRADDSGRVKEE